MYVVIPLKRFLGWPNFCKPYGGCCLLSMKGLSFQGYYRKEQPRSKKRRHRHARWRLAALPWAVTSRCAGAHKPDFAPLLTLPKAPIPEALPQTGFIYSTAMGRAINGDSWEASAVTATANSGPPDKRLRSCHQGPVREERCCQHPPGRHGDGTVAARQPAVTNSSTPSTSGLNVSSLLPASTEP